MCIRSNFSIPKTFNKTVYSFLHMHTKKLKKNNNHEFKQSYVRYVFQFCKINIQAGTLLTIFKIVKILLALG